MDVVQYTKPSWDLEQPCHHVVYQRKKGGNIRWRIGLRRRWSSYLGLVQTCPQAKNGKGQTWHLYLAMNLGNDFDPTPHSITTGKLPRHFTGRSSVGLKSSDNSAAGFPASSFRNRVCDQCSKALATATNFNRESFQLAMMSWSRSRSSGNSLQNAWQNSVNSPCVFLRLAWAKLECGRRNRGCSWSGGSPVAAWHWYHCANS